MHANAQIFFWSYRLKKKICVIKLQSKELYWKLQLIWQTTLVSKWTNSWQPRDARDILFTAIQRYIDSGKDAVLCSIKRPLKIHFAFGNNNEISVSIPGSGVRLAIFCSRVFCQRFNGDEEKFDFSDCQVNFVSNATVSHARDNASEEPQHIILAFCSLISSFFHLAWHFLYRHYWNSSLWHSFV